MALSGDHVQVLVDGYELTGDSQRLTLGDRRTIYDVTTFGDAVHRFLPGPRQAAVEHAGYLNAAAARSHPVLRSATLQGAISVLLGQNASPVAGDPTYSLWVQQGRYQALPEIGKYVPFTAAFANAGVLGGWGVALAVPTGFTATTSGAPLNQGSAAPGGGMAFLHILQAAATDRYTISIEGSATGVFGGEQTTLATFTLNGAALGSEPQSIAGTVPQYVRWKATRSGSAGDTVRIALSVIRF
ncbi:MAG: hypothetical protein IT323_20995 [Anaerolineae bacterium]|nr:hypothetical protein [Anaerolineae bacterium]